MAGELAAIVAWVREERPGDELVVDRFGIEISCGAVWPRWVRSVLRLGTGEASYLSIDYAHSPGRDRGPRSPGVFGVRRILSGGVDLPERPALNFEGATVTDNPAENRIDVIFTGLQPDGAGGFVIGSRTGGWVTVRPGDQGFRVSSNNGKGFAFVVDNGAAEVRVGYALQVPSSAIRRYV